ncbi:MAG: hypothetical protein HQL91_01280 [Magnetococcales bacterium]|nr:hypothetical protein [Magnetococcales bacterium]
MHTDWITLPEERRAIHRPTGLILEFRASTDGSGAMSVDTPNPQAIPVSLRDQAETLVMEGWTAYADASERALLLEAEQESAHSGET